MGLWIHMCFYEFLWFLWIPVGFGSLRSDANSSKFMDLWIHMGFFMYVYGFFMDFMDSFQKDSFQKDSLPKGSWQKDFFQIDSLHKESLHKDPL